MSDNDDFLFEEETGNDFEGPSADDSGDWEEEEEPKKKKGGGSRSRTLLLLLLLVIIAGGGYYYFLMPQDPGPAAPPKVVVKMKKQPVAMPKPVPAQQPAAKDAEKQAMPIPKPAEAPKPVAAKPAAPVPAPTPAPAPVTPKVPTPVEKQAAPKPAPVAEKPVAEKVFKPVEAKPAVVPQGAYSLSAGTFLLQSSVTGVEKKIRALGYEPVLTPVKRKVPMTRLLVGSYPPAEAKKVLADIKPVAPGAFSMNRGKQVAVYAGSFFVVDKARRFADMLFKKGIRVEEETAKVERTLQRVTFGSFASSDEAKSAAGRASAKGLEARVVKN